MTVYSNAKRIQSTKCVMCMHGHGHVSCELLMSIFERNVLEHAIEWEWWCIIRLASTLFLLLALGVCGCMYYMMSIFMLRALHFLCLFAVWSDIKLFIERSIERIQHHTSYWDWAVWIIHPVHNTQCTPLRRWRRWHRQWNGCKLGADFIIPNQCCPSRCR